MNIVDVVSLSSGITSLILAIFAIWLSLHHKKETDLVNEATKKLLLEVHTDAKIVSKIAMPELKAYGESMRKYIFEIKRPENNDDSYEVINNIGKEIKELKESNNLAKNIKIKLEKIEENLEYEKQILGKNEIKIGKDQLLFDLQETEHGYISLKFSQFETVQSLLDVLWFSFLNQTVEAYTYGVKWVIIELKTGKPIKSQGVEDDRPLLEVGIIGGMKYKVNLI